MESSAMAGQKRGITGCPGCLFQYIYIRLFVFAFPVLVITDHTDYPENNSNGYQIISYTYIHNLYLLI